MALSFLFSCWTLVALWWPLLLLDGMEWVLVYTLWQCEASRQR